MLKKVYKNCFMFRFRAKFKIQKYNKANFRKVNNFQVKLFN